MHDLGHDVATPPLVPSPKTGAYFVHNARIQSNVRIPPETSIFFEAQPYYIDRLDTQNNASRNDNQASDHPASPCAGQREGAVDTMTKQDKQIV